MHEAVWDRRSNKKAFILSAPPYSAMTDDARKRN
jgi:hypothetical protein